MNYQTAIKLVKDRITGTRKGLDMPRSAHSALVGAMLMNEYDEEVCTAGLLHDIIEDSDVTYEELRELGFSSRVLELIELVTYDESVKYKDHRWFLMVAKIIKSGNFSALAIKLCDTMDNFKDRAGLPPDRQPVMRLKLETLVTLTRPVMKGSALLKSAENLLTT